MWKQILGVITMSVVFKTAHNILLKTNEHEW